MAWLTGLGPQESGPEPGKKAQKAEESSGDTPSVYSFLRSSFGDVDVKSLRRVSEDCFTDFVVNRHRRQGGNLDQELQNLLRESARRCFRQAAVREEGIRVEEWVHFGLLQASAPSHLAHQLLNKKLRRELARNPFLLKDILHAFEAADVRGAGLLRVGDLKATFVGGEELVQEMQLGKEEQVSYYEFAAICLGYRPTAVCLNWYDVSHGYASWVPPAFLGGSGLEGVWHTGVVAFGKEYWYGGKVLCSEPGTAPFPPGPKRSTRLGLTLRTREELEDFLRFELAPRYTRETYDVLRHNCNHFADEVAGFLIQGGHIPDEARRQPEAVLQAPLLYALRPYLNRWLSGFQAEGCDDSIDDLTSEWRARLWPGDLALYVPEARRVDDPVRLVQVSKIDALRGLCRISFFEPGARWGRGAVAGSGAGAAGARSQGSEDIRVLRLGSCVRTGSFWDWRLAHREGVPLTVLRPHLHGGRIAPSVGSINIPPLASNAGGGAAPRLTAAADIQRHLQRKAIVYAHCPQGHAMKPLAAPVQNRGSWGLPTGLAAASSARCGICSKELQKAEQRLECSTCSFYLCGPCDRKGLFSGFYSLGSIDVDTARSLVEAPSWMRYKARRYMAAAGVAGASLGLEAWKHKVAVRIFGDLGIALPTDSELLELYRRFNRPVPADAGSKELKEGLGEEDFCDLLFELLAARADVVSL